MKRRLFLQTMLVSLLWPLKSLSAPKNKERAYPKKSKAVKAVHTSSHIPEVISVHSPHATNWDFKTYPYVDFINQDVVNKMLDAGIQSLTGEKTAHDAWHSLFSSYKKNEIVAIKPNFNDLYDNFRGYVASPALMNAIADRLVNVLQISPKSIVIYDCTRIIPDEFRKRVKLPVGYVEPFGSSFLRKVKYHTIGNSLPEADMRREIFMNSKVTDKNGNPVKCYLPKIVTAADHIINVPILKSHQFVSHSGALKNHYGTVRFSDGHTGPEYLHPPIIHQSIVDINSHIQIRNKTRLIVMDALFGRVKKKGGPPDRWEIFGGNSPNRLIISKDPVALDCVGYALVKKEMEKRREDILSLDFLRLAHKNGLGKYEEPDDKDNFNLINYLEVTV